MKRYDPMRADQRTICEKALALLWAMQENELDVLVAKMRASAAANQDGRPAEIIRKLTAQ